MAGSKIKGTVTSTVTLGNSFTSPLTITATGAVTPDGYGDYGIVLAASAKKGLISNLGLIRGAFGKAGDQLGYNAGGGVALGGSVTLKNAGSIFGGAGGSGDYAGGVGGYGVHVAGSAKKVTIINSGFIQGGGGGYGFQTGISGSAGVCVAASKAGASLANTGTIMGGYDADSGGPVGGGGGEGVRDYAGSITNSGLIIGGAGGYGFSGGYDGGVGGYGLFTGFSVHATNTGIIAGGAGGASHGQFGPSHTGGAGGVGASITYDYGSSPASFANSGQVTGGTGAAGATDGGNGGAGILSGATETNSGIITGGNGGSGGIDGGSRGNGGSGGNGLVSKGNFVNTGIISGGNGGSAGGNASHTGGNGGNGAVVSYGAGTNGGIISGGNGGYGALNGGNGGNGLVLAGTFTNTGTISGGLGDRFGYSGYYNRGYMGNGGNGVVVQSGVLTNAGTIDGTGRSRYYIARPIYHNLYGNPGAAVDMISNSSLAATLVVDPGAVFNGLVLAGSPAEDTLELAGTAASTLTGIGTQIESFVHISIAAGADWDISGTGGGLANGETIAGFAAGDAITIIDAYQSYGSVTVTNNGVVTIDDGSQTLTLNIAGAQQGEPDFTFANDTLTKAAAKMAFIAPPPAAAPPDLAKATPWRGQVTPAPALNASSTPAFASLALHDAAQQKWSLPLVTLAT